jgi:hypothetical protein
MRRPGAFPLPVLLAALASCGQGASPGWNEGAGPPTGSPPSDQPPPSATQPSPPSTSTPPPVPTYGPAAPQRPPLERRDAFGIQEIYPTAPGGREWMMNMTAPQTDQDFIVSSATGNAITQNADGSWHEDAITDTAEEGVRIEVTTQAGEVNWKNVEITGYVQFDSGDTTQHFSWYGRSGNHSSSVPCDGTAYHMELSYEGAVWYQKEIWHTGGYTPTRRGEIDNLVAPLQGRWIGFKAMIYNVDGDAHVKQEIWLDDAANNQWVKVNDTTDTGGWEGSQAGCNRPLDAILTTDRPIATFRADNAKFDFKWLSVREIAAP